MDILDGSGLWTPSSPAPPPGNGGSVDFIDYTNLWSVTTPSVVPPPTPTLPGGGGDGVTVPGLPPGMLVSTTAYRRRDRLDDGPNPWVAILAWLRRLRRIDDEWEVSQTAIEMARAGAMDDAEIMELTALTRRRQ